MLLAIGLTAAVQPASVDRHAATFGEQAQRAAAARLQYLAGNTARSIEAYADRSAGLNALPSPGVVAYGARWTGLAGTYAAELADAGRWQGLAEEHQRRAEAQRLFHASEWGIAAPPAAPLSVEGLAVYLEIERSLEPVMALGLTADGVATYRLSEWGHAARLVPLP
jgi:hypothetical protein